MITALVPDRLQAAVAKFWQAYIVDECPDEKMEPMRRERINNIALQSRAVVKEAELLMET